MLDNGVFDFVLVLLALSSVEVGSIQVCLDFRESKVGLLTGAVPFI